jgi:hypothetical protein
MLFVKFRHCKRQYVKCRNYLTYKMICELLSMDNGLEIIVKSHDRNGGYWF